MNKHFTQVIQQAREGLHVTVGGEYEVSHVGGRTYCKLVESSGKYPLTDNSQREASLDGIPQATRDFQPLPVRQAQADYNSAPRADKVVFEGYDERGLLVIRENA